MSVVGPCPYTDCDGSHITELPLGAYGITRCDTCGRPFWVYHSVVEPMAWTMEEFKKTSTYARNKELADGVESDLLRRDLNDRDNGKEVTD